MLRTIKAVSIPEIAWSGTKPLHRYDFIVHIRHHVTNITNLKYIDDDGGSQILGHANSAFTMDVYCHPSDELKNAEMSLLSGLL